MYLTNKLIGTTLIQFDRKDIYASRKSKGIFRAPDGIEKLLCTRSKNYCLRQLRVQLRTIVF